MPCQTIAEVIVRLEEIVRDAQRSGDPLGIFASVYLGVTLDVQQSIQEGRFQDGPLMERLDVCFANRYLDAYDQFQKGQPCTASWATAFEGARRKDLLILQHLFMGMNAHINLDLGIAAAEIAPGDQLAALESDFMEINNLLASRIDLVQDKLSAVSPLLFLLDWLGGVRDEWFAEISLEKFRNQAWKTAQRFAGVPEKEKAAEVARLDGYVSTFNRLISNPGRLIGLVLKLVKRFEEKRTGVIMQVMGGRPLP